MCCNTPPFCQSMLINWSPGHYSLSTPYDVSFVNRHRFWCMSTEALPEPVLTYNTMTSSNRNIFSVTGPLWGESTGHLWIPLTKASDVLFDLCLNKRLSKQSRGWWFETQSLSYDVTVIEITTQPYAYSIGYTVYRTTEQWTYLVFGYHTYYFLTWQPIPSQTAYVPQFMTDADAWSVAAGQPMAAL